MRSQAASRAPTSVEWLARQLLIRHADAGQAGPKPINPRPAGQVCAGGASESVLQWLLERPSSRAWWSMHQIIRGTGRSAKACSWAVLFLARHGLIERDRDVSNTRYLRYRAARRPGAAA